MSDAIGFLFVLAIGGGFAAIMLADFYMRVRFVNTVHLNWRRIGRSIQLEPIRAIYFGKFPQRDYASVRRFSGAIGIVDDMLRFESRWQDHPNLGVPINAIRWIGSKRIRVRSGKNSTYRTALVIHFQETSRYDSTPQWRVATIVTPHTDRILATLNKLTGLNYAQHHRKSPDYGPIEATRMDQDIYGQWHEGSRHPFYIAPKWLLFNFRDPVPCAQLQKIEVIERGGFLNDLIPLLEELLRLEYVDADGQHHTVGYMTLQANKLARELSNRSGVRYRTVAGRKKK